MDARPLAEAPWDWSRVRSVLVVRLRSIGDTVLATPSLRALRRFLPGARIDLLLEDWVAPLLEGTDLVDRIVTVERGSKSSRLAVARSLRASRYDVAYNLHGGTTATLLTWASGAKRRVGYASYRYRRLYNYAAPSPLELWREPQLHSAEQQLGLLGWTGVPVTDRPESSLPVTSEALQRIEKSLNEAGLKDGSPYALMHPAAAFDTKTWAAKNFARVAEILEERGLRTIAVVAPFEKDVLEELKRETRVAGLVAFDDLTLPEVAALASRSSLFVGNDSGIAHIAAAVRAPSVVVFGSSNAAHWRPWTRRPFEVVREEMACAPCPGYACAEFDHPECIRRVPVERVASAIERVLAGGL